LKESFLRTSSGVFGFLIWDSGEDEGFESGNIIRILLSRLAGKNGGGDER
jgi:hypothetical protein